MFGSSRCCGDGLGQDGSITPTFGLASWSTRPHQTGKGIFESPVTLKEGVMYRKRLHWQTVVLTVATALLLGGGASAAVGSGSGPPTSVGTGGAAASVERLATPEESHFYL